MQRRWAPAALALLPTCAFALGGCGDLLNIPFSDVGGGGGFGGPTSESRDFPSAAALDGMVFSNGSTVSAGGGPLVGDLDTSINGIAVRQFFSFDLSSIPALAIIDSADIYLRQAAVQGTPYSTHGVVLLEHVDYGASLDAADFAALALDPIPTPLSSSATLETKSIDVLARVIANRLAGRTRFQVRLRFSTLSSDSDATNDAAEFGDAEGSAHANSAPRLRITYTPP
jgi:hypothetical protein